MVPTRVDGSPVGSGESNVWVEAVSGSEGLQYKDKRAWVGYKRFHSGSMSDITPKRS